MPQGQVLTGPAIEAFSESCLLSAAKLELLGMRHSSGRSMIQAIKQRYSLKGTRAEVVRKFGLYIELRRIFVCNDHLNAFPGSETLLDSFAAKALQKNIPRELIVAAIQEWWSQCREVSETIVERASKLPGIK